MAVVQFLNLWTANVCGEHKTPTTTATACDTIRGISVAHKHPPCGDAQPHQPASHPNSCARCGFRLCDDCDDNLTWHNTQARTNDVHCALHPGLKALMKIISRHIRIACLHTLSRWRTNHPASRDIRILVVAQAAHGFMCSFASG